VFTLVPLLVGMALLLYKEVSMTTQSLSEARREQAQSRNAKWGWGILVAISAMLLLNGVALYFISASPTTFEQDTGVPMAEVRRAFPTVADQVVRGGQAVSILLAGFGLLALIAALSGYCYAPRWAWNATWAFTGTLAAFFIWAMIAGGRLDIGGFYLFLAAAALVGQVLARPGRAP
jgi:hypothetical protein